MDKDELKELLSYDKDTGVFVWIKPRQGVRTGVAIGTSNGLGYLRIRFKGKSYYAHRLAWLYMYGYMPKQIDHINGNPSDNRISNLRECNQTQNMCNKKVSSANKSGVKGVSYAMHAKKWKVQIQLNGKNKHIGYFDDFEFATLVADEARNKYHKEFANNGVHHE
jgi:hypothetical protein